MNDKEELVLFLVYCLGFITVGILMFIAADIPDRLTKERVQQYHRDAARTEYREFEMDRDVNRFGVSYV